MDSCLFTVLVRCSFRGGRGGGEGDRHVEGRMAMRVRGPAVGQERKPRTSPRIQAAVREAKVDEKQKLERAKEVLACPVCFDALVPLEGNKNKLQCKTMKSVYYEKNSKYWDLTVGSRSNGLYQDPNSRLWGVSTFQNPFVSYLYERGWRQGFASAGFPGADKELEMALRYFKDVKGGILLDVSCGSGLFTRRFIQSNAFGAVIGSDFSDTMLRETWERLDADPSIKVEDVLLVRADVGRLPFQSASLDAIHAGAAIHCWPNPVAAIAEITRVLKPGGVFVGTTFLLPLSQIGEVVGDDKLRPFWSALRSTRPANQGINYWEEAELKDLCEMCGLVQFRKIRSNGFIMFTAKKPGDE